MVCWTRGRKHSIQHLVVSGTQSAGNKCFPAGSVSASGTAVTKMMSWFVHSSDQDDVMVCTQH